MCTMVMMGESSKVSTTTDSKSTAPSTTTNTGVFHEFLDKKVANLHTVSGFPHFSGKQLSGKVEGIVSYGPRPDQSVSEVSHQFIGNKRNHPGSALVESPGEGVYHGIPETSHVMKLLRKASGGERPRIPPYDGNLYGAHQGRPVSASLMLKQSAGTFGKMSKSERSIPMNVGGGSIQYNPYVGQASPATYQMPSSRFREGGSGPSILSQLAADEGSRTGNKGGGIFKSFNAISSLATERNSSGLISSGYNVKLATCTSEPESSAPLSQSGLTSSTKQMTIIFGGQVHVFDDVHPNKADVIMALAGANGGSWSTTLPKSSAMNGGCLPTRADEISTFSNHSLPVKYDNVLSGGRNSNHGYGSINSSGTIIRAAETAGQAGDYRREAKQEI